MILISQELEPFYRWFHKKVAVKGTTGWTIFQILRTNLLMCFLRTFDCYRDVPLTFRMFGTMFTDFNAAQIPAGLTGLGLSAWDYGILALGTVLLVLVSLLQRSGSVREKIYRWNYWGKAALWWDCFFWCFCGEPMGSVTMPAQFIYNQF